MKGKRHSPEQIIAKLREADALLATGATIGQICQKLAVAEQTLHPWRNLLRRHEGQGRQAARAARAGERPAQEASAD